MITLESFLNKIQTGEIVPAPISIADIERMLRRIDEELHPWSAPYQTKLLISLKTKKKIWWFMEGEATIRADLTRRTEGMRRRQARAHAGKRHRHR